MRVMASVLAIGLGLVTLGCGTPASGERAPASAPVVGWVLHDAPEDDFQAWFPGPPTIQRTSIGETESRSAVFVGPSATYEVRAYPRQAACKAASETGCRHVAATPTPAPGQAHATLDGVPADEASGAGDDPFTLRSVQTPGEPSRLIMVSVRGDQTHAAAFFAGFRLAR